ncbi:uncharacterized protein [Solanum tuberosum]|uniref:uncharacterized protein n=1 Tax=Solanum tuberosum TaxID=4113 RepID=UPI00073A174A|nr:PREDICTED: uncharacterized protein LOC107061185 [Solanum tuberosum]
MDFSGGNVNFAGASNHMTFNITLLTNITYLPCPLLITLPNGYKVKVVKIGSVILTSNIVLHEAPSMKRPLMIGEAKNGLYFLYSKCLMKSTYFGDACATSTTFTSGYISNQDAFSFKSVSFPASSCYPFGSKGYKVLSLATKKIHISRDVVFKENIFPFAILPDISSFPSVLHSVPFIDPVHPNIESQTVQHVENDVVDASDISPHTSPNHVTNLPVTIQPSNPTNTLEPTAPSRPSRPHKLLTHLYDYVLPKNMTKHLQNSNISLNTAFSKHQHVPPEVLALESQTLVRNVSSDDEPSSYGEAAMNPAWQQAMTQEFEALHTNHTWDLVHLPSGKKP